MAILEPFSLWRNVLISHLPFPFPFCSQTTHSFRFVLFVRSIGFPSLWFVRSFVPFIYAPLFVPVFSVFPVRRGVLLMY